MLDSAEHEIFLLINVKMSNVKMPTMVVSIFLKHIILEWMSSFE